MLFQGTDGWLCNSPLPSKGFQHFSPCQNQSCVRALEVIKEALEERSWDICQCWIWRLISTVTGCATDILDGAWLNRFFQRSRRGEGKESTNSYAWSTFFLSLALSHRLVRHTLSGAPLCSLASVPAASGVFLCIFTMLHFSLKHQW